MFSLSNEIVAIKPSLFTLKSIIAESGRSHLEGRVQRGKDDHGQRPPAEITAQDLSQVPGLSTSHTGAGPCHPEGAPGVHRGVDARGGVGLGGGEIDSQEKVKRGQQTHPSRRKEAQVMKLQSNMTADDDDLSFPHYLTVSF